MTKAAAVFLLLMCTTLAMASDWPCTEAGAALLATANEYRRADGEQAFLVSDTFLFLAAACPNEFFFFMEGRTEVFQSWLSQLESRTFRITENERERTEVFLSHLAHRLKKAHPRKAEQDALRGRLLKKVETMCVRVVDHDLPAQPCRRK
jgi:hypothetical protein